MKGVFLADSHTFHMNVDVPDGDILFHSGDLTMSGTLNELIDFRDWFVKLPHTHKVVIAGNHDRLLMTKPEIGNKMFTDCHYLNNSGIEIEGRNIWGSPMTPSFSRMRDGLAFYEKAEKMMWNDIPENLDVLLTHGPPWGILDEVWDNDWDNMSRHKENVGDKILLSKVIEKKPKIHSFGHVHEEYGVFEKSRNPPYDKTLFINSSVVDEHYNVVNEPIVTHI